MLKVYFQRIKKLPLLLFRCQSSSKATHLLALNPQIEFSKIQPPAVRDHFLPPRRLLREQNSLSKIYLVAAWQQNSCAMTMYVLQRESRRVCRSDFGASNTHTYKAAALSLNGYISPPLGAPPLRSSTWPRECRLYGMCGRVSAAAAGGGESDKRHV
jgi:hypothetical protein